MASLASSTVHIPTTLGACSARHHHRFSLGKLNPSVLILPRRTTFPSVLVFARRRNSNSNTSAVTSSANKKKKHSFRPNDVEEDDDLDEDAFEALFCQLEEDLKNDDSLSDLDDDEITEEDLAKLEQELAEALGDDEFIGALDSLDETDDTNEDDANNAKIINKEKEEEDDGEDEAPVKLKNWQLRRLAYALKKGRRKTNIKNLAADLCLDRSLVLELLREPPPHLLMLSAALPEESDSRIPVSGANPKGIFPSDTPADTSDKVSKDNSSETIRDAVKVEDRAKVPVHVMQSSWSARKRLKKVQVETLERVYNRTKRPTNAMISSVVHVTNLPRKRVVKWFEDRRAEDGVPDRRIPYQRSDLENTLTS